MKIVQPRKELAPLDQRGLKAIRIKKGRKPIFIPLKFIRHSSQWYLGDLLVTFLVPHFGQRRCHETFMVTQIFLRFWTEPAVTNALLLN